MYNIKRKYLAFCTIFLFLSLKLNSQSDKPFSMDFNKFIEEINLVILNINDKDIAKRHNIFLKYWDSGVFNDSLKKQIIHTSNLIKSSKLRINTDLVNYLSTFTLLHNFNLNSKSLFAWQQSVNKYINSNKPAVFAQYLNFTANLINHSELYRSKGNSWKFRGGIQDFSFDTAFSINFNNIDLVSISMRDSIKIYATSGKFYPSNNMFSGFNGKVNWAVVDFDINKVYAILQKYNIDLTRTSWNADSATLHYEGLFAEPIIGKIEDAIQHGTNYNTFVYPRFQSHNNEVIVKNLFNCFDVESAITVEAKRVMFGNEKKETLIWLKRNNEPFVKLKSKSFIYRDDRLISKKTSIIISLENDSIHHPEVEFRYSDKDKKITFYASGEGLSASPFFNSYHKIDMFVKQITYSIDDDKMYFGDLIAVKRESDAVFSSQQYYSDEFYQNIHLIDNVSPLNLLYNFTNKKKDQSFELQSLTDYMQKPAEQVKTMILKLAINGFLTYNEDNDIVTINNRLVHCLLSRSKKNDFDVIQIYSHVKNEDNAMLNLNDYTLMVEGVNNLSLSKVHDVQIYPKAGKIAIYKDRSIAFTGTVKAGYFTFYANESIFDYNAFKLNMPQIDSVSFVVDLPDNDKIYNKKQIKVKNVIANLSGEIAIDKNNNKSGSIPYLEYPIFNSKTPSYVYFDNKTIANGIYNREHFFYEVEPFILDSLNSFKTNGLKFKGELHSANILPVINEPLVVMDDYSLGFKHKTDNGGLPIYGGKGQINNEIIISNKGFKANGTLNYLSSTSISDNFSLYPDSLVTKLNNFSLSEQSHSSVFMNIKSSDVKQVWLPYLDEMKLNNTESKLFKLYNDKVLLDGHLLVTPSGIAGKGTVKYETADITSNKFDFDKVSFKSDTTILKLYYPDRPRLSFETNIVYGKIDVEKGEAKFGVEGLSSKIIMPQNKYICYMDGIYWNVNKHQLNLTNSLVKRTNISDTATLKNLVDFDFSGSEFISTDPVRDSLKFYAMDANIDLDKNIINAKSVKIIKIADAAVFPDNEQVTIMSDGSIKPLANATIIANRSTKKYKIYNSIVNLISRNSYKASGYLDYVSNNGAVQPLHISNIYSDTAGNTIGEAFVTKSKRLELSDHFDFIGKIELNAKNNLMFFNGNYKLKCDCIDENGPWVRFNSALDPINIILPVNEKINDTLREPILAGIAFSTYYNIIYSANFQKPRSFADYTISKAKGVVYYSDSINSFVICDSSEVNNSAILHNMLEINTKQCINKATGEINLGNNFDNINFKTFGTVKSYAINDSSTFNLSLMLDFHFSDNAIEKMQKKFQERGLQAANPNSFSYLALIYSVIGKDDGEKFIEEFNQKGAVNKLPASYKHTLILSDINFKWDNKIKSYISNGPINVSSIKNAFIFRQVDGFVEISKQRNGEGFTIYLEISNNEWFFFSYSRGVMQAISSDAKFNEILFNEKDNKRILKANENEKPYQYILSGNDKKALFLRRMKSLNK